MRCSIYMLAAQPITVEMPDGQTVTVKQLFASPGTGSLLGQPDQTLLEAADARGGIEELGEIRVNAAPASLSTELKTGDSVLLIPRVEGGC